jgi:hypothetical protein
MIQSLTQQFLATVFATSVGLASAFGQGAFQNLDFEDAQFATPPTPRQFVPASTGLPGWSVFVNSVQRTVLDYDSMSLGGSMVSLIDHQFPYPQYGSVIDGSYTVMLFAGGGPGPLFNASIAQTGTIPVDSLSLQFVSYQHADYGALLVSFGGTSLGFQPLKTLPSGYVLFGADISGLAGTSGELRFAVPPLPPFNFGGSILDDIQFSPEAVPEPSLWALGLCGGFLVWGLQANRRSQLRRKSPLRVPPVSLPTENRVNG